jgi:hypothetical protein
MLTYLYIFFSVMSIIGRAHKQVAKWTVTLLTEVPVAGITVGKTEQAGRNMLLVFGNVPI